MNKRKVQSVIFYCDANDKKHFLLLRVNKRRGLFWQNSTGSVEDDESFIDGAKREAIEETGLALENIKTITETSLSYKFIDQWNEQVFEKVFFIECKRSWDVVLDEEEHCDFQWTSSDSFKAGLLKYKSNSEAILKCMEVA